MMLFIMINFKSIMLMGTNLISLYFNSELNINLWKGSRTSFIDKFVFFVGFFFFKSPTPKTMPKTRNDIQ